jgi:2-polyprenyl-6-methoxyphenol hydroxylase-like FAD-dependent oxidoreductase
MRSRKYDVVVVGARCAGAATAMLLSRQGARVLVVERGRYGADTLSTLALMRGGVLQLHRWGLLPELIATGAPAVRKTSFFYEDGEVALPIKPRDGVEALYAPRRTALDSLLVDAARRSGAEVSYGVRLTELLGSEEGSVRGIVAADENGKIEEIAADLVIGADGRNSTVARLAGSEAYRTGRHSSTVVYGFFSGLGIDGFQWHFRPGVSAGVMPTNDAQTLVFASMPPSRFQKEARFDVSASFHKVIGECSPGLSASLQSGRQVGSFRGFGGQPGHMRQSYGRGWALVGDAGYFKDPLTAHGITDAFRDAELVALAAERGTAAALAEFQTTRDELSIRLFEVTDEIASFAWDLSRIKSLHLELSREMNREVAAMAALHSAAA